MADVIWKRILDVDDIEVDIADINGRRWRVAPWGRRFCVSSRPIYSGVTWAPWDVVRKLGGKNYRVGGPRLWESRVAAKVVAEKMALHVARRPDEPN